MGESLKSAEEYGQRAADMKRQAERAETVYLQAVYSSIADNWDRLAEQMRAVDRNKDRAAIAQEAEHPAPPPGSTTAS